MDQILLSIVIPVYNEGASVRTAIEAVTEVMRAELPDMLYEVIFVDDGSEDDSFKHLTAIHAHYPQVRVIRLATNCGAHMAIRAGLEHATGVHACFLACDLQDPPSLIPRMLETLVPPVEIAWAVRSNRQDPWLSRLLASGFYAVARFLVAPDIPPGGADMFMLGPRALAAIRLHRERNLTLEGLFQTLGLRQSHVWYERGARLSGRSKWTLTKRLKLFVDYFVGYSYTPIRWMSYLGVVVAIAGFLFALYIVIDRIFNQSVIQGWSSVMVAILLMGGLQMVMIGVIGEYVWRALDEARARPRYIIDVILEQEAASGEKG